jgi:chromosome segregation ATPase
VHTEHIALQAQLSSARTNVDRLTLRLEDAQTALAEKERLYNELQQEKVTLKVQVGKWKSLDDRGGAEVEELHKQRAALETQIKHLQSRVTEEQNKALAREKAFQKEHKKIEKLQQALEEQTVRTQLVTRGDFAKPCFNSSVLQRRQNLQQKPINVTKLKMPR